MVIRLILLSLLAATACSEPTVQVFHSAANDGIRSADPVLPLDGSRVDVSLWIENMLPTMMPPAASPDALKCSGGGQGPEICMWGVRIVASGGVQVLGFTPAADVRAQVVGNEVRANGGNPNAGSPLAQRIGTLRLRASAAGSADVSGGYVSSTLELLSIRTEPVAATPAPPATPASAAALSPPDRSS